MIVNRNDTLRELSHKRRIFIRNSKPYRKLYYRDWVYSFGIGRTKITKGLKYQTL